MLRSRLWGFLAALTVFGCARYVKWTDFSRERGYSVPRSVPLIVHMSDDVRAHDVDKFVEQTVSVTRADLQSRGVDAAMQDERAGTAPLPRVEVSFAGWKPINPATFYVEGTNGQAGALRNTWRGASMIISVKAFSPAGKVMLDGQFRAKYVEERVGAAADTAGRSIAKELAEADSVPMPQRAKSDDVFTGDQ